MRTLHHTAQRIENSLRCEIFGRYKIDEMLLPFFFLCPAKSVSFIKLSMEFGSWRDSVLFAEFGIQLDLPLLNSQQAT